MRITNLVKAYRIGCFGFLGLLTTVLPLSVRANQGLDPVIQAVDQLLLEKKDEVPGIAIAIVGQRQTYWRRTLGVCQEGQPDQIDVHTPFRLASLSKGLTAACCVRLASEGGLPLNLPIDQILPAMRIGQPLHCAAQVTLRHLLSHTSGVPRYTLERQAYKQQAWHDLVNPLKKTPFYTVPGTTYAYQNVVFSLVSPLLEHHQQQPFHQVLYASLLQPMGWTTPTITEDWAQAPPLAQGHITGKEGKFTLAKAGYYENILPAGGLFGSLYDMERWGRALLGGMPRVLPPSLLETLFMPQVDVPVVDLSNKFPWIRDRFTNNQYALGWRLANYEGEQLVFHTGQLNGVRTVMVLLPQKKLGMVVLCNGASELPVQLMLCFLEQLVKFDKGGEKL